MIRIVKAETYGSLIHIYIYITITKNGLSCQGECAR